MYAVQFQVNAVTAGRSVHNIYIDALVIKVLICLATIRVKCEAIGCHCSSIDSIVSFHLGMYDSRGLLSSPKDCEQ